MGRLVPEKTMERFRTMDTKSLIAGIIIGLIVGIPAGILLEYEYLIV